MPLLTIGIAEGGLGVLRPSIVSTYNLTPATVTLLFVSQISSYILAAFTSSLGLAPMLVIAAVVLTMALVIYATSSYIMSA